MSYAEQLVCPCTKVSRCGEPLASWIVAGLRTSFTANFRCLFGPVELDYSVKWWKLTLVTFSMGHKPYIILQTSGWLGGAIHELEDCIISLRSGFASLRDLPYLHMFSRLSYQIHPAVLENFFRLVLLRRRSTSFRSWKLRMVNFLRKQR